MMDLQKFKEKANNVRRQVVETAYLRKSGHIGGALSITDLLISLYDNVLEENDKFILSKGHGCLSYFMILKDKGYSPSLMGHPERDPENGIHCTTGSLGHGLPQGLGMALAKKILNQKGKIFVLMSDAECQEGTTWESLLLASHYKLDNLTIIIDNNKLQTLGKVDEILSLGDIKKKFESFGAQTLTIDGHNYEEIIPSLSTTVKNFPLVIIANTIKGKGVSYMENVSAWHTMVPDEKQFFQAMEELK